MKRTAIACMMIGFGVGVAAVRGQDPGAQDITDEVVKKVDPSVVAIQHERAGGSGFVVSEDGYILTNGHVVQGNDEEDPTTPAKRVTVILHDERKFPATVIGFCLDPDVALIRIEPDAPLRPVDFANSSSAQIGQKCFAVGTPVGLKRTFTGGILSNVDRADLDTFTTVLQTDAAINPGNSGGPLFDREGRVLGINTYASRGQNNLGFTLPIHVALVLKDHFIKHGRFVQSDLPVFYGSETYDELSATLGVSGGILVQYVMEKTPAEAAGLKAGDVIVKFNGKPCSARTRAQLMDFSWEWSILTPGSEAIMECLRGPPDRRETITVKAVMEEMEPMPRMGRHPGELIEHRYDALGLGVVRIVRLHRVIHALMDDPGVLVTRSELNSPAAKAGLENFDIITHVGDKAVGDVPSFQRELEAHLRAREKAIELTTRSRKSIRRTALAPFYGLKDKKVLVVAPDKPYAHLELMVRELTADGAVVTLAAPAGAVTGVDARGLNEFKGGDFDMLALADGEGSKALWTDADALRLVREAHAAEKILAALGTSALVLAAAEPALLEKKITTTKMDSAEAMKRKANYTGNEVEKDGNVITTTAFDRKTVRDFLAALRILARNKR